MVFLWMIALDMTTDQTCHQCPFAATSWNSDQSICRSTILDPEIIHSQSWFSGKSTEKSFFFGLKMSKTPSRFSVDLL